LISTCLVYITIVILVIDMIVVIKDFDEKNWAADTDKAVAHEIRRWDASGDRRPKRSEK